MVGRLSLLGNVYRHDETLPGHSSKLAVASY
jgi:hypothetical protein